MVLIVEWVGGDLVAEVASVPSQLVLAQRVGPRDKLTGDDTAGPSFADAVLNSLDLHVVPVVPEGAQDPTVVGHVPVPIRCALPWDHRSEVRGLERCDVPLVDAVVRDPGQADLAVTPRLDA